MNDKVVSQPVAKLLKEAGWRKETGHYWCYFKEDKIHCLFRCPPGQELKEDNYFAPDLLDLTREIRKNTPKYNWRSQRDKFDEILRSQNEVDTAAQMWIEMTQEGL